MLNLYFRFRDTGSVNLFGQTSFVENRRAAQKDLLRGYFLADFSRREVPEDSLGIFGVERREIWKGIVVRIPSRKVRNVVITLSFSVFQTQLLFKIIFWFSLVRDLLF